MKIIKFKQKRSYSYKRKILIKDLVLNMLVGIHNFEKKKKQRVRFNLIINIDQNLIPNDKDLKSIVNYEQIIKIITKITSRKHYLLLETLAEKIFFKLFENPGIKKILLRIEKLDIIKNATSVGIELEKTRSNEH
jgi:dihydroneopterin aldolase